MRRLPLRQHLLWLGSGILGASLLTMPISHAQDLPQVTFAPEVMLSQGLPNDNQGQVEPSVAVSVTDPSKLAAMFISGGTGRGRSTIPCPVAFSSDAGETWQVMGAGPTPTSTSGCADPSVASDVDGGFYFAYLTGGGGFPIVVGVAKSNDGGRTFPVFTLAVPDVAGQSPDKPYMTVDTQIRSRFRGNVYVAWVETDFTTSTQAIRVVSSRDGARSWSSPTTISRLISFTSGEALISPVPVVGPDGRLYVFYFDGLLQTGPSNIRFSVSSDGGRRWSQPAAAAANLPTPIFFRFKNADPQFGTKADAGTIGSGDPSVAISSNGTIFLAWADFPAGQCVDVGGIVDAACFNADVRMTISKDGGKNWAVPVKVTDETNATDQMFPWIAAHPDGLVSVMWVDKRLDPENINYDIFYTNTRDGRTFLPNVRASSQTYELGNLTFIGDYNNIAASLEAVFPIWTAVTGVNERDISVAKGTLSP